MLVVGSSSSSLSCWECPRTNTDYRMIFAIRRVPFFLLVQHRKSMNNGFATRKPHSQLRPFLQKPRRRCKEYCVELKEYCERAAFAPLLLWVNMDRTEAHQKKGWRWPWFFIEWNSSGPKDSPQRLGEGAKNIATLKDQTHQISLILLSSYFFKNKGPGAYCEVQSNG